MTNVTKNTEKPKLYSYKIPKKGKYLVIVSNRLNALSINEQHNAKDLFALPVNQVQSIQSERSLSSLKTAFERCFVLFDNKTPIESKESLNIARKMGFVWIDTDNAKAFFDIPMSWDISEIHKQSKDFTKFLQYCINTNHQIQKYSDDPDSIDVEHCYKIHFEKYLGQSEPNDYGIVPLNFIMNLIELEDLLLVGSLAGTGKSNLISQIVHDFTEQRTEIQTPHSKRLHQLGIKHTIILEPTTAITDQLGNSFKNWNLQVTTIKGGTGTVHEADMADETVTIVCFDSLKKILPLVEDSLLIIDEFHQLSIDVIYRDKEAFKLIEQMMRKAKKVLLLTATPMLIYTQPKSLHKNFGFKMIQGIASVKNSIEVTEMAYDGSMNDLPVYIADNFAFKDGTILIKRDDKKTLNGAAKIIRDRGLSVDVFHSGDKDRKEENPNYNSLMNTGITAQQLDFLLFTSLLEAGVSFHFLVSLICLLDVESWQKAVQLMSRPRYNEKTGINKINKVHIYRKEDENKEVTYDTTPILKAFKNELDRAKGYCDTMNSERQGKNEYNIEGIKEVDIKLITMISKETGLYEPFIFGINRVLYEKQIKRPFNLFLKRIERYDNRVNIMPKQSIFVNKNYQMQAIKEQMKIEKKEANKRLKNLLYQDFTMCAHVVCFLALDVEFKKMVQNTLGIIPVDPLDVQQFLKDSQGAFTGNEPKRIMKDVCFFKRNTKLNLKHIISKVLESDKKAIKTEKNQIKMHHRKTALRLENDKTDIEKRLSGEQLLQVGRLIGICKVVDQYVKNTKKGLYDSRVFKSGGNKVHYLTSEQIFKLINRGINKASKDYNCKFKPVNKIKAKHILEGLYELTDSRVYIKSKLTRVVQITGKRSTPKYIR